MKEYYFISGLPRSGSTLLSAILKQNPDFYADIASPVSKLVQNSIEAIAEGESNFTIEEFQRKNLIQGIFDGYYKHIDRSIIFDSSRMWTSNTNILKSLFPYTKIICTVRDVVSVLNSFEVISSKNPFYPKPLSDQSDNIFARCDAMMDKINGVVGRSWISLYEGYAHNPEMIYFIEYKDLCKNPQKIISDIYSFLEKPHYSHDFENIEYSNENFDKACNLRNLHTVRKKVEYKPPKNVLPPDVVKKYREMNMEFWSTNYSNNFDIIEKLEKKFIKYQ